MKIKLQFVIIGLTILSCSDSLDSLPGKNLYTYTVNHGFFPKELEQDSSFYAEGFADKLKQLDEKSLSDKYRGDEIVRLTAIRSFSNHFTISIERTDNEVRLTEKETFRDSRPLNDGDTTRITYNIIEFDSLTGKYMDVRKSMTVGTGPAIEIEIVRKVVDPLLKNETRKIKPEDWNGLTKLLDNTSFFEMCPVDTIAMGFDGHHFVLETHSKNGYFVVDRWSPRDGDFKTIIDYIIGLSDYKNADN
jgi:hypothetical protein